MKRQMVLTTLFLVLFCCTTALAAQEGKEIYFKAQEAAKQGDFNAAFLELRALLQDYPGSRYTHDALFGSAEYYFLIADYKDAVSEFVKFILDYPNSKARPFAMMYLYKMAKRKGDENLLENLKKEIIDFQQLILLFRDYKEYKYKSPLQKKYRVVYYIDKAEFYVDGELFEEIPY